MTQILAFEGQGNIEHVIGGYSDYLEFRNKNKKQEVTKSLKPSALVAIDNDASPDVDKPKEKAKMTFKDKYALENLPKEIEKLNVEITDLSKQLADPEFYQNDSKAFNKTAEKLDRKKRELDEKELQFLELEEIWGKAI